MKNILDQAVRKQIINEIKGDENKQRKIVSFKKMRMQQDKYLQYVREYLESKLDAETVNEMKIFASVNLQKRISKAEGSIYRNDPERAFYNIEEKDENLPLVYSEMGVNNTLKRANIAYKYQDQCAIQVLPMDGELKARVLLPHHYDVVPNEMNPEIADCYIISNFDNTDNDKVKNDNNETGFSQGDKYRDGTNQTIGDYDDAKLELERFYWYSDNYHFVTNGKAEILDKETQLSVVNFEDGIINPDDINVVSPLKEYEINSFIDIADDKDFSFWVDSGDTLYETTLLYNTILTSEFQVVEMQGHAQAYYKGDANHMPENLRIGTDKVIFLPVDPNNEVSSEFGFANPNSDLAGVREFRESFMRSFLSSRGLDTSILSGDSSVQTASSGVEKMLQMVEKFEASQDDLALFEKVEKKLAKVIVAWINAMSGIRINGKNALNDIYKTDIKELDDLNCSLEFGKPELIKTEMEKLELLDKEKEIGLTSNVHYLMEEKGMSEEQAVEHLNKVEEYEGLLLNDGNQEAEVLKIGSKPNIQP